MKEIKISTHSSESINILRNLLEVGENLGLLEIEEEDGHEYDFTFIVKVNVKNLESINTFLLLLKQGPNWRKKKKQRD